MNMAEIKKAKDSAQKAQNALFNKYRCTAQHERDCTKMSGEDCAIYFELDNCIQRLLEILREEPIMSIAEKIKSSHGDDISKMRHEAEQKGEVTQWWEHGVTDYEFLDGSLLIFCADGDIVFASR